jgi:tetratricopeptide (TPR) repeat protein
MGLADRTNSLRQMFCADSPPGARLRRRVAAIAGMVAFLLALLASLGFLRIVLVVLAVAAVAAGAAALLLVCGRSGGRLVRFGKVAVRRGRSVGSSLGAAASRGTSRVARSGSRAVVVARRGAEAHVPELRNRYGRAQAVAGRQIAAGTKQTQRQARAATSHLPELRKRFGRLQAAAGRQVAAATAQTQRHMRAATTALQAREPWATPTPVASDKEALHANAAGAQLRREGAYVEAAQQHRAALSIFRELGDRRSEALTLNNLALALDRAGEPGALDLFEESAAILGELGEKQQEGEVIANLALAFRRRGSEERSAEVLELALEKLSPESQAYQKVEGLRRAS